MNRTYVQLSKTYKEQNVIGWYMSSKLDGFRCVWDGGVTRGIPKDEIPWANTDKDHRYKVPPIATGLWTRYGNVIHAPDWFLDMLPVGVILDGEMWADTLSRQQIIGICSRIIPNAFWEQIQFHVFNRLSPVTWLSEGRINNPNMIEKNLTADALGYYTYNGGKSFSYYPNNIIYGHLVGQEYWSDHLVLVKQEVVLSKDILKERLILEMGRVRGEGLILTDPFAYTKMQRTNSSLKVKPRDDAEATVMGYVTGKGKLRGLMGALVVKWDDKIFELSGFTDAERTLSEQSYAWANEGAGVPEDINCPLFPIGTEVKFSYRGLTDDGIPNEAVYMR